MGRMPPPYRVELVGVFYTAELYDQKGRQVFGAEEAAEAAEAEYGAGWSCVYNGEASINREDWIQHKERQS